LKIIIGSVVGTGNTYTYSVNNPRSDRERYIREAPMDLRSSCQYHLSLGRGEVDEQNGD
jgi:hypothetical protein